MPLAEDDARIRAISVKALRDVGYQVVGCRDGEEACALNCSAGPVIDLLCTDVVMPGLNGAQLADLYRGHFPEGRVILCSGYVQYDELRAHIQELGHPLLDKPCSTRQLLEAVSDALQHVSGSAPPLASKKQAPKVG